MSIANSSTFDCGAFHLGRDPIGAILNQRMSFCDFLGKNTSFAIVGWSIPESFDLSKTGVSSLTLSTDMTEISEPILKILLVVRAETVFIYQS